MASKPTVFVIDDDNSLRESLCWLAESNGLAVQGHADVETFLRHFDRGAPGCVVVDVRLPGMSGIELQEELGRRASRIPVIVITGYPGRQLEFQARQRGAFDFVPKPFDDLRILASIKEALAEDRRRRRAALPSGSS